MDYLDAFKNLDLLSVGMTIAAIFILGITVFLSNRQSATSRMFLLFSAITVAYGVFNYLSYHVTSSPQMALNLIRATLFFAVWHAFSFYLLFYVFPDESSGLSLSQKFIVLPITIAVSLLALTPLTLSGIKELSAEGRILKAINGPAIALFGIWIFYLVAGGIFLLIKKMSQAKGHRKKQFATVSIGVVVTFSLLVIFNFIYPAILDNARFVPLAALFMLPFIGFAF